jgi:hypothetical protein
MKKARIFLRIFITALGLALLAGAVTLGIIWGSYSSPAVVGSTATGETDVERSQNWLMDYMSQVDNWRVPPSRRLTSITIDEPEDLGDGCVQLNFSFTTLLTNARFNDEFGQCVDSHEGHNYSGSLVLRWENGVIVEVMRPAAWQIAYSPEIQEEREQPETQHYATSTYNGQAYLVENETLYVTYDDGATYIEVPSGYDYVCRRTSGGNQERLTSNQYIVTSDLTAFIIYNENDFTASLYYSTDEGQTWTTSLIADGYQANSFLSLTTDGVYATFATDRAAGSDYYATYFSSDLSSWTDIPLPSNNRNYTCVYWPETGVGYYSGGEVEDSSGETSIQHYATFDNGASYQSIECPPVWSYVEQCGGVNPFDMLDEMYDIDGVRYMVIGQGDDGDLTVDGKQIKLRYSSTDGMNFEFDEQETDSVEYAG